MASSRLFLAATLALSTYSVLPALARADDVAPAEADVKHVFQGAVNANAVQVRSRPSEDAYATMKLKKDDHVTVVGIKGQWLKIEPPKAASRTSPSHHRIARRRNRRPGQSRYAGARWKSAQ